MQQDYLDNLSGTSTEVKPTTVANGTRFYETDTGAEYVFQNNKWQPAPGFVRLDSAGNAIPTKNLGVTLTVADSGWLTGNTGLVSSLASYTVGGNDADFEASFFLVIIAFTSGSVSCTVNYTDPTNTIRNATVSLTNNVTGATTSVIQGGGDMSGSAPFRAKAGTTITLQTSGTPTSLTYDIIAKIKEVS
ncbi:MAG: hypothetical protein ACREBQ_12095 [Nitrososphaerales archaeon]